MTYLETLRPRGLVRRLRRRGSGCAGFAVLLVLLCGVVSLRAVAGQPEVGLSSPGPEPVEVQVIKEYQPPPSGWCCQHGSVFPSPAPSCRESGGAFFGDPENAQMQCRAATPATPAPPPTEPKIQLEQVLPVERRMGEDAVEEYRPPSGWCCLRGDVFPAPEPVCRQERGAFFPTPEAADQECRFARQPHEPPPHEPREAMPGEPSGWCCLRGDVFPAPEPVCRQERGAFFPTPEAADRECRFAERPGEPPPHEPREAMPGEPSGWCCLHGDVFPAPEPVCRQERGAFFPTPEAADQECRFARQPHEPPPHEPREAIPQAPQVPSEPLPAQALPEQARPSAPVEPSLLEGVLYLPDGPPRVVAPSQTGPPAMAPATKLQLAYPWVRTGGPLGGLGYDVRMTTGSERVMYVSDAWAGVFKSNDAGKTWFPVSEHISARRGRTLDAVPIFSLTVDPHDASILWAGTKDQVGIFKSTNGGQSWSKLVNGIKETQLTIRGFTVDPKKSDIVYMAAEIPSYVWDPAKKKHVGKNFDMTRGVVYQTIDGGKSWKSIWYGDNLARYVWIDPRDSRVIYISTGIFDREAKNTRLASAHPGLLVDDPGGVGIFKSTDGGKHWQPINQGLGNLYVGSLFMHPKNPDILLAGTGCNPWQEGAGVYVSLDAGKSWEYTLKGDVITSVEFASNPRIAYAGSKDAIYRSEDTGRTWHKMTTTKWYWGAPGVRAGWPIDFQADPNRPDRIFANNYGGGNFLSTDGGRNWVDASKGYTGAQIRDLAVDPKDGRRVLAVARSGVFESNNSGNDWKGLNNPPAISLDWPTVAIDPLRPQHVLASSLWYPGRLFEKQPGMSSWSVAAKLNDLKFGWRAIAFAPSNSSRVYAGTGGVASFGQFQHDLKGKGIYFSIDGGRSWNPTPGTASPKSPLRDAHVVQLVVHPQEPQVAYAATLNHGVLRTRNGGQSWETRNHLLPAKAQVLSIALNPKDPSRVYVGLEGGGLYRSLDAGLNWNAWMPGIDPNASISDIVFDPAHTEVMYVSDLKSGVYRLDPDSQTFVQINIGLDNREVTSLAISSDGWTVYAGTEGAGVFRLDVPRP
jgi:photosystem II stability/assembly factor-like uncharacterized protein